MKKALIMATVVVVTISIAKAYSNQCEVHRKSNSHYYVKGNPGDLSGGFGNVRGVILLMNTVASAGICYN